MEDFGKVGADLATKGFVRGLGAAVNGMKRSQIRLQAQLDATTETDKFLRITLEFAIEILQNEINFNETYIANNS